MTRKIRLNRMVRLTRLRSLIRGKVRPPLTLTIDRLG